MQVYDPQFNTLNLSMQGLLLFITFIKGSRYVSQSIEEWNGVGEGVEKWNLFLNLINLILDVTIVT